MQESEKFFQEKREITEVSVPSTKISGETCFYVVNVRVSCDLN